MSFIKRPESTQISHLSETMLSHLQKLSQDMNINKSSVSCGFRSMDGSIVRANQIDISKINYFPYSTSENSFNVKHYSLYAGVERDAKDAATDNMGLEPELFPKHTTSLMNEDQHWGCFYIYPGLYQDGNSPTIRVRELSCVPELVDGVLTRDMVAACLSYLKRTPILGDFVYIKLDLSSKLLVNIEVLQHYKFLVYLDLSSNLLKDLSVLSHLRYLQYLLVNYNRLESVLDYDLPPFFLTEVHYKFNSVKTIRDISGFWSITVLDLSHNNIKAISGLENLHFLRRLDLSFNHIQCLENLNNLRLTWLDVSYNNLSSFEYGPDTGLWTLLHLEFLNLNENKLNSLKMFAGCVRLQQLHLRNNQIGMLLELAVYMRQLRRLIILDLRENPICVAPSYKAVIVSTFPILLSLDSEHLDPVEQRDLKMNMSPDVHAFASRRLMRLLYIEQLSRAKVSPFIPPADTVDVPIVVLVGPEASGKGYLARRLATECSKNIELAKLHTSCKHHGSDGNYIAVSRQQFDDMLLAGDFLTYGEMDGESYGLSREEAFVKDGKVKIVALDLISALMLKLRGLNPYLILAVCLDKNALDARQLERKAHRISSRMRQETLGPNIDPTLQVLVSGRLLVSGILNEVLNMLPENKEYSEFVIDSECSLLMDSEARKAAEDYANEIDRYRILNSSSSSLEQVGKYKTGDRPDDASLCSLFKEKDSQVTDEYTSNVAMTSGGDPSKKNADKIKHESISSDTERSSECTPNAPQVARHSGGLSSFKSVTFSSQGQGNTSRDSNKLSGLYVDPIKSENSRENLESVSKEIPTAITQAKSVASDIDLWLAFLFETGMIDHSNTYLEPSTKDFAKWHRDSKIDDPEAIMKQLAYYRMSPSVSMNTTIRDEYEHIHRNCPGLFWDTVDMDKPEQAFKKVKRIIKDIVNSQPTIKPMFDIDFSNMDDCPLIAKRLQKITKEIAPHRLFF